MNRSRWQQIVLPLLLLGLVSIAIPADRACERVEALAPQPTIPTAPTRGSQSLYLPLILKRASTVSTPTCSPTVAPTLTPTPETARRPWPATSEGIHVFNDQLTEEMSDQQVTFCARHYAGTQKMIRSEADRLRAVNPDLLILHYRLGHALGYRSIQGACQPSGEWLGIIVGDDWVQEWPGDDQVQEAWFYHWPEGSQQRLLNCDWGWYLMEIDNAAWRSTWHDAVLEQVRLNDDDGIFMDSLSVPNYLGGDRYVPALPAVDTALESAWARRINAWLTWLQGQPLGDYYLVPNVGSWITTRDTTDYGPADGLMIEGFAIDGDASPYDLFDWRLQMDRILSAGKRGQAIIAQTYAIDSQERMFALGCYLLIKGERSYLNIEGGLEPEWWPEYDLPVGAALDNAAEIDDLLLEGNCIYGRRYDNCLVLVNPTSPWDGSGQTRTVDLGSTYYLAETSGGGEVPETGIPPGSVSYRAVTQVTLGPYSAAVLFTQRPN